MNRRRIGILVLVMAPLAVAAFVLVNPLNRLALRLEFTQLVNPGWQSGFWTPIDLPKAATIPNLVDRLAQADLYTVIDTRKIWIWRGASSPDCTAVLVDTPNGRLICLFQYVPWTDSWKARLYST